MIVVDTNVLSYFYLSSKFSDLADSLYQKDPKWTVPYLWRSEFRNVLSFYIKRDKLSLSDAIEIFETAELFLRDNEFDINSIKVLMLSRSSGCSAYNCEFVSLAQDLDTPLVTVDRSVLENFPETAISIQDALKIH